MTSRSCGWVMFQTIICRNSFRKGEGLRWWVAQEIGDKMYQGWWVTCFFFLVIIPTSVDDLVVAGVLSSWFFSGFFVSLMVLRLWNENICNTERVLDLTVCIPFHTTGVNPGLFPGKDPECENSPSFRVLSRCQSVTCISWRLSMQIWLRSAEAPKQSQTGFEAGQTRSTSYQPFVIRTRSNRRAVSALNEEGKRVWGVFLVCFFLMELQYAKTYKLSD